MWRKNNGRRNDFYHGCFNWIHCWKVPNLVGKEMNKEKILDFIKETVSDFKTSWELYPNVHIWWTIAFLIALFV